MPSGGALFGNSSSGPGSTGGVKHLVEFKAGRMNLKGRMVHPDKRKGLLYIYQSEDSLMHFCWQDRHTGVVEDDLIIFPDDCEYVRVPQCTTGRVFVLKFKSSNRKLFFWMQEPRTDRDEEYSKRINEYLNNPPGNLPSSNAADQDLQSLLNNMSQSQLMQLFGGVGQIGGLSSLLGTMSRPSTGSRASSGSTPAITHRPTVPSTPTSGTTTGTATPAPAAATAAAAAVVPPPSTPANASVPVITPDAPRVTRTNPAGTNASNPIQLADLQNFLQGISSNPDQSVDLSSALTADALSGILNSSDAIEQLQSHLPAVEGSTQEQLRSTLTSPQFQQAVSQFSSALQSGQLGPVVSQLAVNPEAVAAATQGNMRDFVKALEKNSGASGVNPSEGGDKKEEKKEKKEKKDDDEDMQLD